MNAVGVGSSVCVGAVDVGAGEAVVVGGLVGRDVAVAVGCGVGVAVSSGHVMFGMHGGEVVGGGDGEGVGDGVGSSVGSCASAALPTMVISMDVKTTKIARRLIYISTTRCVSVERTPVRLWIWSRTTSAR
jgi:hypothetical protein